MNGQIAPSLLELNRVDLLFLHTPKFHNYYQPIGEFSFVLFPPIGLLGLADYLVRSGYTSRIVHLGVERHLSGALNLEKIIAEHQPTIIGLDLHWHFQSYDVIEVARKIKQAYPQVAILLGGFTASIFAEEILRDYPFIDFVIRGDAEVPVVELVRCFLSGKNYAAVPNLSYRLNAAVVSNGSRYVADSDMLDSMCFTDFTLMKDYPTFVSDFSRYLYLPGRSKALQDRIFGDQASFPVMLGRGCAYDCSFCGGCHEAHDLMGGRKSTAVRSADSVVASIRDLVRFGFQAAGLCHDCCPPAVADDYYISIFDQVRHFESPIGIHIERYHLPTQRFLESFRSLPQRNSSIALSVHTQNEALRRKNGFYRYSNQALEETLGQMEAKDIHSELFFECGLPFETKQDLEEMAGYHRSLREKFRFTSIRTAMIEIEPGSPMSRRPADFAITPERSSFADFYRYHAQPDNNHFHEMGYKRCDLPRHRQVRGFYCRHFCGKIRAGVLSPYICKGIEILRIMGAFAILDSVLALKNHRVAQARKPHH